MDEIVEGTYDIGCREIIIIIIHQLIIVHIVRVIHLIPILKHYQESTS